MRAKIVVLCIVLAFSMLFSGCAFPKNKNNILNDHVDAFDSIRKAEEEWLLVGLEAYESGRPVADMSEFFSDENNLIYLTLYDDIFYLHREQSNKVAAALFSFIYENYGADALLDIDKRVEYKNAYLDSLGVEQSYLQLQSVETFFSSMRVSSNDQYKYIMSFDGVTYYFKNLDSAPSISLYRQLMFYTCTGLDKMIEFIQDGNMSEGLDIEREFDFYMTLEGGFSQTRFPSGNMYINHYSAALHEAMHAMGVSSALNKNIWLSEGICEYFGKMLGFNPQIAQEYFLELAAVNEGKIDQNIEQGDSNALKMKYICDKYLLIHGQTFITVKNFDLAKYIDIFALYEIENGVSVSINDTYYDINGKLPEFVGGDMSYEQVASFANYLAKTYSPQTLMEAYRTDDVEGTFGKDYEALREEWIEYLNELIIEK